MSGTHGSRFREGIEKGILVLQSCPGCRTVQTGLRERCAACGRSDLEWQHVSPTGTVYAHTIVHRAPSDAFKAITPYTLCLVELIGGARIMGHCTPGLAIGTSVEGTVREIAGASILYFDVCRDGGQAG